MPGILRFVIMLFLIFEKKISKTTVPGFLRFLSILFFILKLDMQIYVPGILRFVSMLSFNI